MKVTKTQVRDLAMEDHDPEEFEIISTEEGGSGRWSRYNYIIFKNLKTNKYYKIFWQEGLTENQEHEFESQEADEVEPVEETVIVKKWVLVNKSE